MTRSELRASLRSKALVSGLSKLNSGVPTCTVPEAAALMSVSADYLYDLIGADQFPAVYLQHGEKKGRYVVPTAAIRQLVKDTTDGNARLDSGEWTSRWNQAVAGGDAA